MSNILIICFDTPYPCNYGGVFDVEKRIQYLKSKGYCIDLICFCLDSERINIFKHSALAGNDVFSNVFIKQIYPNLLSYFSFLPYSLNVRSIDFNEVEFIKNKKYDFVLFEHLKTTANFTDLKKVVHSNSFYLRMHNDEFKYFLNLSRTSVSLYKKTHYFIEALKYGFYQNSFFKKNKPNKVLFISEIEMNGFSSSKSGCTSFEYLPIFYGNEISSNKYSSENRDIDFFYVGNLDLDDNYRAVHSALKFVNSLGLSNIKVTVVGRCSTELRRQKLKESLPALYPCNLNFNISYEELMLLYSRSKFFLNFSENEGGVKTKLIESLCCGVPVVSNQNGIYGSSLDSVSLRSEDHLDCDLIKDMLFSESNWFEYKTKVDNQFEKLILDTKRVYDTVFDGLI